MKRETKVDLSAGSEPGVDARVGSRECGDCGVPGADGVSRRRFLGTVVGTTVGGALGSRALAGAVLPLNGIPEGGAAEDAASGEKSAKKPAETFVKLLYDSLKEEQRKVMCFPFDHELRSYIANNWDVVDPKVGAIGTLYTPEQQELIRHIFRGVTSEEGHEKFKKQMQDDAGGFDKYTCAVFGEPGTGKFQFLLTGRHLTIRADGDSLENTAFGGPIFYGHAVEFNEKPDHPGNVWWHQARLANEVYRALDGGQQKKALLEKSPEDSAKTIQLPGAKAELAGLPCSEMSKDQQALLEKSMKSLLSMYRESDVKEVLAYLAKTGGIDKLHMSFYREGDIGDDGIWDRWMVQGPGFAWYFRGSPHVHTWVHVGFDGKGDPRRARV